MPEYLHPGVYVQEVAGGARPIEGASTSTAAFVGTTLKGRPNRPEFLISWTQFVSKFGYLISDSYLPYSVSKFFENGGKRCYVVRALNEASASTSQRDVPARRGAAGATLRIDAAGPGAWGDAVAVRIEDGTDNPTGEFKIVVTSEGEEVEVFDNLSMDTASLTFVETEINEISEFITVEDLNAHVTLDNAQATSGAALADPVPFAGGGETFTIEMPDGTQNTINVTGNTPRDDFLALVNNTWSALNVTAALDNADQLVVTHNTPGFDRYFILGGTATGAGRPLAGIEGFEQGSGPATGAVLKSAVGTTFDTTGGNVLDISVNGDAMASINLTVNANLGIDAILNEIDTALRDPANRNLASVSREDDRLVLTTTNRGDGDNQLVVAGNANTVLLFQDYERATSTDVGLGASDAAFIQSDEGPFAFQDGASFTITVNNAALAALSPDVDVDVTFPVAVFPILQAVTAQDVVGRINAVAPAGSVVASLVNNRVVVSQARPGNYYTISVTDGLHSPNIALNFEVAETSGFVDGDKANPYFRPAMNINPIALENEPWTLSGGDDGSQVGNLDYIGRADTKTGLHALDELDNVNFVAIPGRGDATLVSAAVSYCSNRKDSFFIADSPPPVNGTITNPPAARNYLQNQITTKTSYGALYYPWVEAPDPIGAGRNPTRLLPPSGYVAGLYARTDNTRGVWKAPAGTEARLFGAIGLEYTVADGEQDILNPVGVNCLRNFAASGLVIWGARTLATQSNPEFKYVPVRRLAIFLEVSIFRGTQWTVFEPNGPDLWTAVKANIEDFLMGVFLQGGLAGTKPSEAFDVKVDADLNPQSEIDAGRLNIEVRYAPLKPAEFVIIRISQKRPGD